MEIKNVNKGNNNYPQKLDITEKTIKENMLDKWKLIGIASIISNGLLASVTANYEVQAMKLSGDIAIIDENVIETENTTNENIMETENTIQQSGNTGSGYSVSDYYGNSYSENIVIGVNEHEANELSVGTIAIVGVMVIAILIGLVELTKNKGKKDEGER